MNAREYGITTMAVLVLGFALGGCAPGDGEDVPVREVPRNVRVLQLGASTLTEYFEIAGPVTPVRAADLSAEESGPVVAVGVEKGAAVAAGGIVVEQERAILAAELAAARAALATQAYNVDKVRQLYEAGKVSRMELLNAEASHAQVRALAEVGQVRHERAAIKAPFAGVVVDRFVELGELQIDIASSSDVAVSIAVAGPLTTVWAYENSLRCEVTPLDGVDECGLLVPGDHRVAARQSGAFGSRSAVDGQFEQTR